MDKTYAAVTGNVVTDWPRVIERLDTMSHEEHGHYKGLAEQWPTCAVGNSCAIIPRMETESLFCQIGAPRDVELLRLGKHFYTCIAERRKLSAATTWQAIEARAAIVVAQELAKLNAP